MEKLVLGAKKLGLELSERQLEQFSIYYRKLAEWNQRINLTAITDYGEVQTNHFLDSLTITLAFNERSDINNLSVIDIGTGAGIPGIPLKIIFPDLSLLLIDSVTKKTDFLHHLIRELRLENVEILTRRAEVAAHNIEYRERFDIALGRAVAPLPTLVEYTLPFCMIGGSFIAQKRGNIDQEMARSEKAIEVLGGKLREIQNIGLEEFPDHRQLVIIDKIAPTPQQFPRRSGIPAKRPII